MNCPSCQVPLPPAARFCGACGHQLTIRAHPPTPGSRALANAPTGAPPFAPTPSAAGQRPPAAGQRPAAGQKPSPSPARDADPMVGQLLNGRFRVDAKLGEGGFGAVYRGVQVATGRKVALKLLHPEMTRDENLVARFRREGLVLCNLRDPHTITTYDFDQTPDGTLYIAMELLEGKSLHEVFHSEAPIDWRRVLKIATQMASSLGEAHRHGIVHRDLKPENIYLENRGGDPEFVKILDFGIAKVMRGENMLDPNAPQLTATGQTLGTLEYMSPEQLMGKALDGRSDIYALGVLCYELLTGRLPFPDAKGPAVLITAQLKQTPKPPSAVHPAGNIPPGVDRFVLTMLEKNKEQRFADVATAARAAQECLAAGGQWSNDIKVPGVASPGQHPQAAPESPRTESSHAGPMATLLGRARSESPAGRAAPAPAPASGPGPRMPTSSATPPASISPSGLITQPHFEPPPGTSIPGFEAPRRGKIILLIVGALAIAAVLGTALGLLL